MRILVQILCMLGLAQSVAAQQLNLFEPVESDSQFDQVRAPEFIPNGNGQPAFTVRGTSRFGDEFKAVLVNRNGSVANITWHTGESVQVPGFNGYSVTDVTPSSVSVSHLGGDPCIASQAVGVSCASSTMSLLTVATAAALASNGSNAKGPPTPQNAPGAVDGAVAAFGQGGVSTNANGQQVFINPFSGQPEVVAEIPEAERLAREERQQQRSNRLRQFEVPRINDADVPPGMQVVRTPFGDRLVPRE